MLIDSHAHLPADKNMTKQILEEARKNDVEKVIAIGPSLKDAVDAIELARNFENVYATIGIYPDENQDQEIPQLMKKIDELIEQSRDVVVGVGECGIDITNNPNQRPFKQQVQLFEEQMKLALRHKLPIVIHNRNGDKQVTALIKKYAPQGLTGVAHCFDGSWDMAQNYLSNNFYLSFSGFLTFKSKNYLIETAEKVPNERFLLETDAPLILPKGLSQADEHGNRVKNEPKNVKIIANKMSEIKNLPYDTVCKLAYENTCNLFNIR